MSEKIIGVLEGIFRNGITRDEAITVANWNTCLEGGESVYSADGVLIKYFPLGHIVKVWGITEEESIKIAEYFN